MPKILGLITARGGSKGIPGKNMKLLGGLPLIDYTIRSAKQSLMLNKLVLSTDSVEIAEHAGSLGIEIPFIRPSELAQDNSKSIDVVLHAIDHLEKAGEYFDMVCLLQPTTPFRKAGFIDSCIQAFLNSKADSLISVLEVPHEMNPHWTFEKSDAGFLKIATGETEIISRRQELPAAYHRDGSVYLTSTETLKGKHSFFGDRLSYCISDKTFHINLDTPDDWQVAESLVEAYQSTIE